MIYLGKELFKKAPGHIKIEEKGGKPLLFVLLFSDVNLVSHQAEV